MRIQNRKEFEHKRLLLEHQRLETVIRNHDQTRNARANGMTNYAIHRANKLRRIKAILRIS